jgi:hypothetical protein
MLLGMMKNKVSMVKLTEPPEIPVFEISVRQRGEKAAAPNSKPEKRDNVFSQSRDTREDRGARQMKTSHNSQTFPHAR